jgi:CheY-like chemotaxis protein
MTLEELRVKNKVIMLVDDNSVDNFINEKIAKISLFTQDVYVHSSAKSALGFLKKFEENTEASLELIPSYIFLDINMPVLDGFYFLDEFELLSKKIKSRIKIIMLTTFVKPGEKEKFYSYERTSKCLTKPLAASDLINLN